MATAVTARTYPNMIITGTPVGKTKSALRLSASVYNNVNNYYDFERSY